MPAPTENDPVAAIKPRSFRKRLEQLLTCYFMLFMVRLLKCTYRIRVFGAEERQAAENSHAARSFCLALWHEHLFASIIAHANQRFAPLASLSSDGEIVSFVMNKLGFQTIRGSSSRRGEEARDELVEAASAGFFTAITVDGPRGPRRRVKGGIVDVARRTGVTVLPVACLADRYWTLRKSRDQFQIPKPFAKLAVRYVDPIAIPPETSGLAFGTAKSAVRGGLIAAEEQCKRDLESWT